jgi:hypothetical protein
VVKIKKKYSSKKEKNNLVNPDKPSKPSLISKTYNP